MVGNASGPLSESNILTELSLTRPENICLVDKLSVLLVEKPHFGQSSIRSSILDFILLSQFGQNFKQKFSPLSQIRNILGLKDF